MARTRKKNSKMSRRGRIALMIVGALLAALCLFMGCATVNASILRVRRAELTLNDLPAAFDGVRILFASDIDLCGVNTAEKAGELFTQLQALKPDMLILGGDYTSSTLFEILNSPDGDHQSPREQIQKRTDFFHYISAFEAPIGKFAIAAPEDIERTALADEMSQAGVRPLFNDHMALTIGDDMLWLVGISPEQADTSRSFNDAFQRRDCVVAISYSPELLPSILTSEAKDGGSWADLVLCGHTHGGQIRLLGQNALPLSRVERQYRRGWFDENGLPVLVTEGVGCEGVNMRVGTAPEVWMITLRRP